MRKTWIALALCGLFTSAIACSADMSADYGGGDGDDSGWGTGGDGDGEGGDGDGDSEPNPDPEDKPEPEPEPVCDMDSDVTLYLSPDDSNSMSSPVQARESILGGGGYFPVRVWEFLNYYDFDYPVAESGAVTVRAEMRATDSDGEFFLQIGVGSEEVSDAERAPLNITLVLDESGSMSGTPIEMLKESCRAIASSLREGDVISLVTWDTDNAILLAGYQVSGPNDSKLLGIIDDISAGGGTDLHGGLVAGYELADAAYDPGRINRIVLISDGGANVGITDEELIGQKAGGEDSEGIYMVGVGVGDRGYNDVLMDTVTDAGKGASVFIPSEQEAWKIFGEDFVNTLDVAVRDVQVQLDMPPGFEIMEFSGEEYSPNPEEIEPQHLAPNDSMVFLQRIGTCAPELSSDQSEITVTVRYKDALTFESHEVSVTKTFGELLETTSPQLEKGLAVFRYAQAVGQQVPVSDALAQLQAAEGLLPGDGDLAEIRSVLEKL